MRIWTLYCHIHIDSGRRYIGLTAQTMEKRWKNHVNAALRSKGGRWHFPNAIRKHGADAFTHEVLAQSWTLEGANATEEGLILQYDTRNPEKGFNLAKGGAHVPHPIRKNPWDDPTYRTKQLARSLVHLQTPASRAAHKAALNTPESRAKRSSSSKEVLSRPEVLAKVSAAAKRNFLEGRSILTDPDVHKKIGIALRGRKHRPESIVKMLMIYEKRRQLRSVLSVMNA